MSKKEHVALTRCYFCGEPDRILLATKYRNTREGMEPVHDLAPANGKAIDMEPCRKCADLMKRGIIMIGIDSAKSAPGWNKEKIPDPWRTGPFLAIKEEAFCEIFHGEAVEFAKKHRFAFVEHEALEKIGLLEHCEREV